MVRAHTATLKHLIILLAISQVSLAHAKHHRGSHRAEILPLPARPLGAITGSAFLKQDLTGQEREDAILHEIESGNIPDFERTLKAIQMIWKSRAGTVHQIEINVLPDYLAVGSNRDYARVPMTPGTAQKIADLTGTNLPTKKLVDLIYQYSEMKLEPQPKPPGPLMSTNAYYLSHNQMIEEQRAELGAINGQLMGGHKKDVVVTNKLNLHPDRVAIYGWHLKQTPLKPIQPLSTVHGNWYADYSHGIRLISKRVLLDGRATTIADILKDSGTAAIFSDEGPILDPRAIR